jgi:predicted aspartyl protease
VKQPFDTNADAIVVEVELDGPSGTRPAILVLDTGAATTLIDPKILLFVGYGPSTPTQPIQFVSASGTANAAILEVAALRALGQEVTNFPVVAHALPPATRVDGVLGLDFLRGKVLTFDFRTGFLTLA